MRAATLRGTLQPRVALFSDVDGTLLDAQDRLAIGTSDVAAISAHVELILASSRTLVELAVIQGRLGIVAPLVAENGAVVSFPPRWRGGTNPRQQVFVLGRSARLLMPRVRQCAREVGVTIVSQRDLLPDRARSLRRGYSVCVRDWSGPDADRFLDALDRNHLHAKRSGMWITITSGADKGSGARAVLARARRAHRPFAHTVSVGNAANDVPLLAATEQRFAIRNPRIGHHPELMALPGVIPLAASGARAWREVITRVLSIGKP